MSLRIVNLPLSLWFRNIIGRRCIQSKATNELSADEEAVFEEEGTDIEKKRNKSRLQPQHRNILFDKNPYDTPIMWYHNTVRYKKRILGRYGMEALGVPAGVAWPTPEEVEDMKEYERVAFPLTLQERWQNIKEKHRKEEEELRARQEEIASKMTKMNEMISEVRMKIAKKAADAEAAKLKKERRLKEIRSKLALSGHVTSSKVADMLTKLEKEDKKKKKEAKQKRLLERHKQMALKSIQEISENTDANAKEEKKAEQA